MNASVIISCAVTGAGDTVGKHPAIPVTPREIADSAIKAHEAGAAIVHLHVRDPRTGKAARDPALYRETVGLIRSSGADVVINLTAGMGGDFFFNPADPFRAGPGADMAGAAERVSHVEELLPEICTLDCGSLNFGNGAFLATADVLREMARRIQAAGVKPEIECFELGHVWLARPCDVFCPAQNCGFVIAFHVSENTVFGNHDGAHCIWATTATSNFE